MGDGSLLAPRFDPKGKSRASTPSNGDILALDLGSAEEGTAAQNGGAFMQMELVEQQVRIHITPRTVHRIDLPGRAGHIHSIAVDGHRVH